MDFSGRVVKYNAQTNGRDKLCRVIQYGSKFGWWYCEEVLRNVELVKKLKSVESTFATTRKVMRLGKSLDMVLGALKSIHLQDALWRLAITMSKLNMACYLLIDHLVLATKIGVVKADTKKWTQSAARFWLAAIIFNLARNLYDIWNVIMEQLKSREHLLKPGRRAHDDEDRSMRRQRLEVYQSDTKQRLVNNLSVWLDTIRNVSDLFLPMSTLKYVNITAGTQGILGTISSLVGILTAWNSSLKLTPA